MNNLKCNCRSAIVMEPVPQVAILNWCGRVFLCSPNDEWLGFLLWGMHSDLSDAGIRVIHGSAFAETLVFLEVVRWWSNIKIISKI